MSIGQPLGTNLGAPSYTLTAQLLTAQLEIALPPKKPETQPEPPKPLPKQSLCQSDPQAAAAKEARAALKRQQALRHTYQSHAPARHGQGAGATTPARCRKNGSSGSKPASPSTHHEPCAASSGSSPDAVSCVGERGQGPSDQHQERPTPAVKCPKIAPIELPKCLQKMGPIQGLAELGASLNALLNQPGVNEAMLSIALNLLVYRMQKTCGPELMQQIGQLSQAGACSPFCEPSSWHALNQIDMILREQEMLKGCFGDDPQAYGDEAMRQFKWCALMGLLERQANPLSWKDQFAITQLLGDQLGLNLLSQMDQFSCLSPPTCDFLDDYSLDRPDLSEQVTDLLKKIANQMEFLKFANQRRYVMMGSYTPRN